MTLENWQSISQQFLAVAVVSSTQVLSFGFLSLKPTFSQIIPDNTLSIPSQVTVEENTYTIEGGTAAGNNLFHSFQDFSVPTGTEAFFNNATTVENILTRVTGGNLSNIDGLIRSNGSANLFLLNPNGLIFGPNARLDIGGSFFGSTADRVVFEDEATFSAVTPENTLLTVSTPIGVQFNGNSADIQVSGVGHDLTFLIPTSIFSPLVPDGFETGLQVPSGQTLALVGNGIVLDGGRLRTPEGRTEIGSVRSGRVMIQPAASGWQLDYESVSDFNDIQLRDRAAIDASGLGDGSIQMVGRRIALTDNSQVWIQNRGVRPAGEIRITASETLEMRESVVPDTLLATPMLTGFHNETVGPGEGGAISISTGRLVLQNGGRIVARTFGDGVGGDIVVDVSESIEMFGPGQELVSLIIAQTAGTGRAGDVSVSTENLSLRDGSAILSTTFSPASGGDVLVNASDIELSGLTSIGQSQSSLSAVTLGPGAGGNLTVNVDRLTIRDSGRVDASTVASGNAGNVIVNASEFIEVSGTVPNAVNPSQIIAGADLVAEALQEALGLPTVPSGNAGNLEIDTPLLIVDDRGLVNVRNEGTGNAGTLSVEADSILLDREGSLSAATEVGNGGNIDLQADTLQLQDRSQITAAAGGTGDGGNLRIDTRTLVLLENSAISANAFAGLGGNIQLTAQGIFSSPDSQITASSQLGVDGLVEITQPEIDTSSALVSLSSEPIDPTTQIVSACGVARDNSFVVRGNGGFPPDPTNVLRGQDVWVDTRLSDDLKLSPLDETNLRAEEGSSFAEAVYRSILRLLWKRRVGSVTRTESWN
ncbi:MAG: S-layer family protein [Cyanobacteria bacterium SID2]|nr:S-layer family protein [Cyanobacteria bacterium SID2]